MTDKTTVGKLNSLIKSKIGKEVIQEMIEHRVDVVTDSDWFTTLIDEKLETMVLGTILAEMDRPWFHDQISKRVVESLKNNVVLYKEPDTYHFKSKVKNTDPYDA